MPDFVRVRDKSIDREYTVVRSRVDSERHEVLEDERAVDLNGRARPDAPATKKTSDRSKAAASKTKGDEPADTPKEGSA